MEGSRSTPVEATLSVSQEALKEIYNEIKKLRERGMKVTGIIINEKAFTTSSSLNSHEMLKTFDQRLIGWVFGCKVYLYLGAPRIFAIGE